MATINLRVLYPDAYTQDQPIEVPDAVAAFLAEDDNNTGKLGKIDERQFALLHYDTPAWGNMRCLATECSAEDEYLNLPIDRCKAEAILYEKRLARCREWLPLVRQACTQTQWRRFILHRLHGLTMREIAKREGCRHRAVEKSIQAVEKKILRIYYKWREPSENG